MNNKRVAQLIRMFSSNSDGELLAAMYQLKKLCSSDNISMNDLGNMIENGLNGTNGNSKGKLSTEEMKLLYETGLQDGDERGYKRGLEEGKILARRPGVFDDVLDHSDEQTRVSYVEKRKDKLKGSKEREFIDNIVHRSMKLNKPLTPGQLQWFNDIYKRLGGK